MICAANSQLNNSVLSICNPLLYNMQSQLTVISICLLSVNSLPLSLFLTQCSLCKSFVNLQRSPSCISIVCGMQNAAFANWKTWNVAHRETRPSNAIPQFICLPLPVCPPVQACLLISQLVNSSVAFAEALRFLQFNSKDSFNEWVWLTECLCVSVSVCEYEWLFCCCVLHCCCCLLKCCLALQSDSATNWVLTCEVFQWKIWGKFLSNSNEHITMHAHTRRRSHPWEATELEFHCCSCQFS